MVVAKFVEDGFVEDGFFSNYTTTVIDQLVLAEKLIVLKDIDQFHPVEDLYREMRFIRRVDESLRVMDVPISSFGNVAKGDGSATPRYIVLNDGWRIRPHKDTRNILVTGEILTSDGQSGAASMDIPSDYEISVVYAPPTSEIIYIGTGATDTTAPVWDSIEGISNAYQNGTSINISWGSASDANTVSYNIYLSKTDLNLYASTSLLTNTSGYFFTLDGLDNEPFLDSTSYYIGVRAVDVYGNETTNTNYASVIYDTPVSSGIDSALIAEAVWESSSRTLTESISASGLHTALDSYANKDDWKAVVDLTPITSAITALNNLSLLDIEGSTMLAKEATLGAIATSIAALPDDSSITSVLDAISNLNDVTPVEVRAAFDATEFKDKNTEVEIHAWLDTYTGKDTWKADVTDIATKQHVFAAAMI